MNLNKRDGFKKWGGDMGGIWGGYGGDMGEYGGIWGNMGAYRGI